jgi:hypothetical protein
MTALNFSRRSKLFAPTVVHLEAAANGSTIGEGAPWFGRPMIYRYSYSTVQWQYRFKVLQYVYLIILSSLALSAAES